MDYPGKVITKTQVTPTQTSASGNWTLDDQAAAIKNNNWPVALVPNPISKSLRFNSADSAYLNRTFTTPTNNKIFTWSSWIKLGKIPSSREGIFLAVNSTGTVYFGLEFNASGQLNLYDSNAAGTLTTTQVFRDPSAWYHVVMAVDTTQATSTNRIKLYLNGLQITTFSTTNYAAQNSSPYMNSAISHSIGSWQPASGLYFDGYMTEANFIDGQALTPSDFGLTNPQTGQWIPKKYTGTYGTNGFYLNFKDATSTTTLGYDYSGNANNWTTNNFSVTAGSGNDSLTDVPTPWVAYNTTGDVGGVIRGNYATLNPLAKSSVGTLDNGNLQWTSGNSGGGTAGNGTRASIGMNVGKWYTEVTRLDTVFWSYPGISNETHLTSIYNGGDANSWSIDASGQKVTNNSSSAYGSATWAANDIINIAYDADNGELYFGKNGTWLNSGNPVTRTNPAFTSLSGTLFFTIGFSANTASASSVVFNFGQRPFAYTPPAGFRSLCTTNLPATTIGFGLTNQANNYFNAVTYAGGGAGTVITTGFYPDFAWMKNRTAAFSNFVQDSVRGGGLYLLTDTTDADAAVSPSSTFSSTGITINANSSYASNSSYNYVAWAWKANAGSTVTNTAGTITSTVSANTTAGFSIVTYTGNGVDGATTGHGLGVAPNMVIVKRRDVISDWNTKHSSLSSNNVVFLNSTSAQQTPGSGYTGDLNSSTTITFKNGGAAITNVNGSGNTYVAYCFAAVAGYSAFGSYTGNGSADGPFVYLGFRPEFVMIKRISAADNWVILDAARSSANPTDEYLWANLSSAEVANLHAFDFLSNGFKIRNATSDHNTNGSTYIYMAFAESPFQFANAR